MDWNREMKRRKTRGHAVNIRGDIAGGELSFSSRGGR
jgi:hypothetical protein